MNISATSSTWTRSTSSADKPLDKPLNERPAGLDASGVIGALCDLLDSVLVAPVYRIFSRARLIATRTFDTTGTPVL
jgi:hypothetical protein